MAKWGSCDFSELKKFQQKLEKLTNVDVQKFCEDVSREIAQRLLRKAINRTPVGDYSGDIKRYKRNSNGHKKGDVAYTKKGKIRHENYKTVNFTTSKGEKVSFKASVSGKVGGTLHRGWTAKTEAEAISGKGKGKNVTAWVQELPIKHIGKTYQIDVTNVVNYASYVEFGHRTRNHKDWVDGYFMLTIAEQEINSALPKLIEQLLLNLLKEVF